HAKRMGPGLSWDGWPIRALTGQMQALASPALGYDAEQREGLGGPGSRQVMGDMLARERSSFKLPGFDDEVERDFGDPGALCLMCQKLFGWLRFFEGSHDQTCRPKCLEVPGEWTMIGMGNDWRIACVRPGNILDHQLPIVAHFAPDGG